MLFQSKVGLCCLLVAVHAMGECTRHFPTHPKRQRHSLIVLHHNSDNLCRSAAIIGSDLIVLAGKRLVVASVGSIVAGCSVVVLTVTTATASVAAAVLAVVHIGVILFLSSASCHNALVGLLVAIVSWVKGLDGSGDVLLHASVTILVLLTPVVSVARGVQVGVDLVISEEHVLSVIVHEVALLLTQVELSHEASDSQFLNDLEDVELLIQTGARLALQLVLKVVGVAAAEAPRAVEILLAEESPH